MKKDFYNIKINPPQPSSEDIAKHQDFDALLAQFKETPLPEEVEPERKPRVIWLRYAAAAAAVFLLAVMVRGLLQGEKGMSEEQYFASQPFINPPLDDIKPTFASTKINANEGGIYEYDNGSKLIVPAAAFRNADGKLVEGEVEIEYREMHDYVDFFLSGIPMTYDSAGTKYVLESAGMVEIIAKQNGQPVKMQPGKEIKVELISYINMPRLNVNPKYNIYKLNASTRSWEYRNVDNIQIIEELDNEGFENEELNILKTNYQSSLTQITTAENIEISELEATIGMPIKPTRPLRANSNEFSFDLDISDNASPVVKNLGEKYQNIIWHISPNSPKINTNAFNIVWESMDLKPLDDGLDFELTLINGTHQERVIVTPALSGNEFTQAMSVYDTAMENYRNSLKDRNLALTENREKIIKKYTSQKEEAKKEFTQIIEEWRTQNQSDPALNQMVRKKIINRFVATEFGVWNCDRPIHPDDLEIEGDFELEEGAEVTDEIAYLVNKNRNTIVRIYAKDGAKVNFDQKSDNLMWMVTKDNQIAIFRPQEFKKINQKKGGNHTFKLKVEPDALKSEEDVRKVLQFKEM
ncbi:MAG: hypothetical protein AB8H03_03145 [Saprospiraceae bacterium]